MGSSATSGVRLASNSDSSLYSILSTVIDALSPLLSFVLGPPRLSVTFSSRAAFITGLALLLASDPRGIMLSLLIISHLSHFHSLRMYSLFRFIVSVSQLGF